MQKRTRLIRRSVFRSLTAIFFASVLVAQPGWSSEPASDSRDLEFLPDPALARFALVVGAKNYRFAPALLNPLNDAEKMNDALQGLGFQTLLLLDPTLEELQTGVESLAEKAANGSTALFYFAGHGFSLGRGGNYLAGVDFDPDGEAPYSESALDVGAAVEKLSESGARVVVALLDACRTEIGGRSMVGAGFSAMNGAAGQYLAFAASHGQTASDNPDGENGLFTAHLLAELRNPVLSIHQVLQRVRTAVYEASGKKQLPWVNEGLLGDFYFAGVSAGPETGAAEAAPSIEPENPVESVDSPPVVRRIPGLRESPSVQIWRL